MNYCFCSLENFLYLPDLCIPIKQLDGKHFAMFDFFLSNGHVGFLVKVSNDLKLVFLLFPKCLSETNSFASKTPILPSLCFLNF